MFARTTIPLLILALFSMPSLAAQQWYFGGGIGHTRFSLDQKSIANHFGLPDGSRYRQNSAGLTLTAGFQFDPILAVETDLVIPGEITATTADGSFKLFNISGMNIKAVLGKNIGGNSRVFGGLGAFLWDASEDNSGDRNIDSGTGYSISAGLDYNLFGTSSRLLRLQWLHQSYNDVLLHASDTFSIGLVFD